MNRNVFVTKLSKVSICKTTCCFHSHCKQLFNVVLTSQLLIRTVSDRLISTRDAAIAFFLSDTDSNTWLWVSYYYSNQISVPF